MGYILYLVLIPVLFACSQKPIRTRPDLLATRVGDQLERSNGWLNDLSAWHVNSPALPHSIQVDPAHLYRGEPSLRFEMRPGDAWVGPKGSRTFRSELIPGTFPPLGSERIYSCSILLPKDFPVEKNRLVLLQWWPQTKSDLGEVGRSPSLALRYSDGVLKVTLIHSDTRVIKDPESVSKVTLFETTDFKRAVWNDFEFEVKWSFRDDGKVRVRWDGVTVTDYHGPVGYNDDQGPLFKFGMYRDDTTETYVANFSNCREAPALTR